MSQRYIGGLIYNPPGGYSGYFDGSGDYLTVASNAALGMGSGDFTVELWFYYTATPSNEFLFDFRYAGGSLLAAAAGTFGVDVYVGAGNRTGGTVAANTWYHLAVTRSGSTCYVFLNGTQVGATFSDSTSLATGGVSIASRFNAPTQVFPGYISNFRVVKGTAVYTAAFTPPNGPLQAITNTSLLTCAYPTFRDGSTNNFTITVNGNTAVSTQNPFPLTTLPNPALGNQGNGVYSMSQYQSLKQQGLWPAIDPYWRYVTLMLHGNGTNGAQNNTFLDSSTNNFTITRNGNTTQGTFSPYGSNWGNYFNIGPTLSATSATACAFGTSDFTIELWVNLASYSADQSTPFASSLNFSSYTVVNINVDTDGTVNNGGRAGTTTSNTVPLNQWTHIAISRSGTTAKIFINGVQGVSYTDSNNYTSNGCYIGARFGAAQFFGYTNGYISNLRVVKGTALYTAAFTPSTAPLTAITNTTLLTCQSNRFVDNSSNALTITVNGSPSVQRFSPFAPTSSYSTSVIGGSGYFDGSGDYLSVPDSTAFTMGSGDFSVECWYYPTNAARQLLVAQTNAAGNTLAFWVEKNASNQLRIVVDVGGTQYVATATATMPLYAWSFLQVVRSGTTVYGYQNGTQVCSVSVGSGSLRDSADAVTIGGDTVGLPVYGYISDVRILKGTAASATTPTAPLTAITNTQLLTNFTNAGIIDNASMCDLETVGNAQISTTQSKFGGGSMYFDGAGDGLQGPDSPNLQFGTGDFTVEFWTYLNATSGIVPFVANGLGVSGTGTIYEVNWSIYLTSSNLYLTKYVAGTQTDYAFSWVPSTGTWYHVAISRSGTSLKAFINGAQIGTTQTSSLSFSGATNQPGVSVGQLRTGSGGGTVNSLNGYIDDLRITKGYARYTANFTPQRSQWQDQ